MGLRYLSRYQDDKEYYITKNCDLKSLMKIQSDIEKAREELKQLEMDIYNRVQRIQNIVHYKEIACNRRKHYKGGIEITVYINEYMTQDGVRLEKTNTVYGTHKSFNGSQKKQAIAYANELKAIHHHPIVFINWK